MKQRLQILILLLMWAPRCDAQQYPMLHYTQEDGLPSNNVYRVFQDTDGMLWYATDKGVSRYNGLKFENFTTADGLPDNDIFYFQKDHEGRLWMAAYNGELVYYKDGIFHTAANTPFLKKREKSTNPRDMRLQADGSILIVYETGSVALMIHKDHIQEIPLHPSSKLGPLYLTKKGKNTFAFTYRGMNEDFFETIIDTQGNVLKSEQKNYLYVSSSFPDYHIQPGLQLYSREGESLGILPDSFSAINRLNAIYKQSGHLFLCTNYGLWIDGNLVLKKHKVSSLIQALDGNFWITTLNNGVYKLPGNFKTLFFRPHSYTETVSTSIQERDIVFGTSDMNLYRISDTGVRCFFNYNQVCRKTFEGNNYIVQPFMGNYYVLATQEHLRVRPEQNLVPDRMPAYKASDFVVKSSILLHDTELYLNILQEIVLIRPERLFIDSLIKSRLYIDSFSRVYQMQVAPDSSLWLSQEYMSRMENRKLITQRQLGKTSFRQIAFCKDFLAGIDATNHLVLIRHYNSSRPVKDTVMQNCVWNKFCSLTDSSILVSTNDYYRVITFGCNNPESYRVDILEYPFIPQLAEWIHSDKRKCYFFKKGAITGINIPDLISQPALPELSFSLILAGEKKIPADTQVMLAYNDSRNLSLYYQTLSFNTDNISFEYSVSKEGQADNWTKSNGTNIDLFNISSGDYTIRIRALTFGGRYSAVKTLQLHINAPFWLSWWFITLVIGITGLAVFLVVRVFARRRLEKKEKENKFLRSEFTALNALMNPHFVFNSLNSVQSLINKEDLEAANQYVRTISDLLRQNMHNISRELIPLKREMELIDNYMKLEKLRFKERLQYTITMAEEVEEDFVLVPPLLVQPLVENAIKYTLAFSEISTGRISIDIYTREEKVYIDVTDNGRGLNASKAQKKAGHESTALGNIKSRLEQLSQIHGKEYRLEIEELKNESGDISGTRARISIEL